MPPLSQLHQDIDDHVQYIRQDQPDWLCTKGCDTCCRQLADLPQLSAAEWFLLRQGLAALPCEHQHSIRNKVAALPDQPTSPITCPLLDTTTGACPVYAHRPVACRSYGFYVQRDKGLYCEDIKLRVTDGSLANVVWGNHDAIDQRLATQGDTRSLKAWFETED